MPYWIRNKKEYQKMDFIIKHNPGIRISELARKLGVHRSTVTRRLPSLEEIGYLYSEDQNGGLYVFRRNKR